MIRPCRSGELDFICAIINEAAQAYRGVIPRECWKEPYMSHDELEREIDEGVSFWGYDEGGGLVGVMGMQRVRQIALIRHAYVRAGRQHQGIGSQLLSHLRARATRPILIGTWAGAIWAIRFYERRGFRLVPAEQKDGLLARYWSVPEQQMKTSVVLASEDWFEKAGGGLPLTD